MCKCQICGEEFNALGRHIIRTHSMTCKEYYDKYVKQANEGICPICGKETSFTGLSGGYHTCCSISCANIYTKPKREQHNIEKYGCKYSFQADSVKNKIKQTNLHKYGVENPQQNKEIRKRTEDTLKAKYGGIGASSKIIYDKMQATNLQLYGARNVFSSEYGKAQIRKTNNERYNVDYPTQNTEIMQKVVNANKLSTTRISSIKQTMIIKYGGMGAASKVISEKMQKTSIDKYGAPYFLSSEASKQLSQDKYGTDYFFQSGEVKAKCIETKRLHNTFNSSKAEEDFYKELCELFNLDDVQRQYSDDRYPFACDFYVKSLDMFIELNLFWTHGKHWFYSTNQADIEKLNKWKAKDTTFYRNAIYNWTVLDVKKRTIALQNNLNYIVLWNTQDIYEFLQSLKRKMRI